MKALILAAGLGSRLKDNTQKTPKTLVEIKGKPILYYQLNALKKVGINDIVIVLGYRGELIKKYLKKYHNNFNVKYVVNNQYNESNSSFSFWLARDYIKDESYLHLNCDVIFSEDLLFSLIKSNNENVIAVRTDINLHDNMENVKLQNDKIIDMSLIHSPEANGKAFGLAKLSSKSTALVIKYLCKYIQRGDLNQNYYGMIRITVKEMNYHCIISNKYNLLEVNTVTDLAFARNIINESNIE